MWQGDWDGIWFGDWFGSLADGVSSGAGAAAGTSSATATGVAVGGEQPSGGYGWANLAAISRRRRKRELEEEADRLEMALAAEGLVTPSPEVVARHTVREYAPQVADFSRRAQRAIAYAEKAQTAAAYQLALRQIQRELEDEETAVAMLLALVA